ALAMASLEGWQAWPGGKMLLLGDHGTGKTHLATIWASENGAQVVAAKSLAEADIPGIASGPVVVEDAYQVAGQPEAEAALFHLHNLAAQNRQPLLLTATTAPRDWGLALPDLLSRMQAAPVTRIEAPDDMLL